MFERNDFSGLDVLRGHHFYSDSIDRNSTVIDLGGHLGQFSQEVCETFGCKSFVVEALPYLYEKIVETDLIKKFNYAITSKNQPIEFHISKNPEANCIAKFSDNPSSENLVTVQGITFEHFLEKHKIEYIDLLKIDIEGAEIDLFDSVSDETLSKIGQITIEFHDFKFQIKHQVQRIKIRLKKLGFMCIVFSIKNNGDVLFINKHICKLHPLKSIYIRVLSRYTRGFSRMITRHKLRHKFFGIEAHE